MVPGGDQRLAALMRLCLSEGDADWDLTVVGGGRRGKPSHDADFVVTHQNRCCLAGCCHDQLMSGSLTWCCCRDSAGGQMSA